MQLSITTFPQGGGAARVESEQKDLVPTYMNVPTLATYHNCVMDPTLNICMNPF